MTRPPIQQELLSDRDDIQDRRIVKRSNDDIGFRIKSGHLSVVSRKFLNILVWYAQELRFQEDEYGRWGLPLNRVLKDAKFKSRNYDLARDALDELQQTRVIRPARGGGITSEVIIPSYTLDNIAHEGNESLARGEKRRGGELWLWFMFPPELKSQLLDPNQYTRLPIAIMASLRTVAGLALYEITLRYATNPGGVTNRDTWQNWWHILAGATPDTEPPEYKYAKRDIFKKAVEEVNKITDLDVELVEFKVGKFVRDLQFGVKRKQQASLDIGPPPVDPGMLSRITALGMSITDAERLLSRHSEAGLVATVELVEQRIAHPSLPPVESPAAYFRKALRDGYAEGKLEAKVQAQKIKMAVAATQTKPEPEPEPDLELIAQRRAALNSFDAMDEVGRAGVLNEFIASNPALRASVQKNPGSKAIRNALAGWLMKPRLVPTDT